MPAYRVAVIALALAGLLGLDRAPATAQGVLSNGANHAGSVGTPGEVDEWTFTADQGDAVVLNVGQSGGDPAFWPWLRVIGPTGATLVCGNCWGNLAAQMAATIPLTGTYTVRIASADSGNDATGDYVLTLARTPGAFSISPGDHGGPVTNGLNYTGRIEIGDLDMWSFTANQGDSIVLNIGEIAVGSGTPDPGFWPWIRVYGPGGATLVCGNCWGDRAAQMAAAIPLTGTYTVVVSTADSGNDAVGDYVLTLARAPGEFRLSDGDQGGALTTGLNHTGRIEVGDLDMWSFSANQGDAVVLAIGEIPVGSATPDPGFWPWIRVFGPGGATLVCGNCWGNLVADMAATIPLTGTYTVVVSTADSARDAVGDYRLTMARIPATFEVSPGDQGGVMINAVEHAGRIEIGDLDIWTFTAAQGANLQLTLREIPVGPSLPDPGFWPWLRLYGPTGSTVTCGNCWDDDVVTRTVTAPLSGTYTVVVFTADSARDAPGDYTLRVLGAVTPPPPPTAVPDTYPTTSGTTLTVAAPGVLANDVSPGGVALSAVLVAPPASGGLVLGVGGGFSYTPNAGFTGADAFTYRATSVNGASNVATVAITVDEEPPLQPPTALYAHAIAGNQITLRWSPPAVGPRPSGYVVEGGVAPGQPLATLPTGSAVPLFAFAAPNGAFYLRVRSVAGADTSTPSNEIRVFINQPVAPSAPSHLLGLVNGSSVALSWRPTFAGGAASSFVLDVSGTLAASLPLGLADTFTFNGVPGGTYTFSVRAVNAVGSSASSNPVTLSFPSVCTGIPQPPADFLAYHVGNTVRLLWNPATTGTAPTVFVLNVSGAYNLALPLSTRGISAPVPPGSYTFTVAAANACGSSPATAPQTVVVP